MEHSLGAFEELVLLSVAGLSDEAYAVTIQQVIEGVAKRKASMGAVYTALERLQTKGYLTSRKGNPTPERGGRAKRFYSVTGSGRAVLDAVQTERDLLRQMTGHTGTLELG